ncbi:hypothetical protein H4R33_000463 [Dimargaris cristalligena]|nr:hypothetical protein H4R33_000463 [Dimargaris cristalligena]
MRRSGHDGQISHEPNLPSSSDSDPDQSSSGYCTELFKDSEFPFPDNTQWDLDHTDDEPVHNGVGGWEGYNYFKDDCPDTAPNPGENCDVDPLGGSKTGSICGYAGESDDNDMGSEFSAIDGAGEECYPSKDDGDNASDFAEHDYQTNVSDGEHSDFEMGPKMIRKNSSGAINHHRKGRRPNPDLKKTPKISPGTINKRRMGC